MLSFLTKLISGRNQEQHILRDKLILGKANLEEALRLYEIYIVKGEAFPLDLEEMTLQLGLKAEPDRSDLAERLSTVLYLQNKWEEVNLSETEKTLPNGTDVIDDYQAEMHKYNLRAGLLDMDKSFLPIFESCKKFTMTSSERMFGLYKAIEYITRAEIPGAIVECGVWRGGSMMIVSNTLQRLGNTDRELYLFDTYEGLPRPDEELDVDLWNNRGIDGWVTQRRSDESSNWAYASIEEVRANLEGTGYPNEKMHFVKGMVENTIPHQTLSSIAILRLDTDWYKSTRHELEHLFPRISPNGIIIIDDYGHFKGARKAVDEYFEKNNIVILLNRLDYSGRIGIKNL